MNLGKILETKRVVLGITPAQAAAAVGISRRQWDRLVKGDSPDLRMATAKRLSVALGLSVEDLSEADEFTALKNS